ncbi:hypothetical protein HU200_057687 [Digitaria exilis]|uniref:non-specific serine/threonine protein kinase n=1 Tax=Digitaria exilis TaxID=1010633 RepID=A0A835E4F2_9POAL|nr:hypothetical protein HU200_057687 [Digitaria exilis]
MEAPTATRFANLPAMIFPVLLLFLRASSATAIASDTLNNGGNITDDGETTLVSSGGSFTLGFFSPTGVPAKRYLGIWFTASPDAICWVANRDTPLSNTTSGVLVLTATGILRLLDGRSGQTAWSSNSTTATSTSSVAAQLLDSGNLVVRGQITGGEVTLWQSFDHPSNTLLAGMRLGKDPQTGVEWSLTSWRAPNDPTTGDCRRVMDTKGLPDCVSWQGNVKKYRTGPWNGLWFSGVPEMASYSELFSNQVIVLPNEVAYVFNASAEAPFSRLVLNEVGVLQRLAWDPASRVWNTFAQAPRDVCDDYAMCGAFGICDVNTASTLFCSCIVGFGPVNPTQWSMRESGAGCRRNAPLECGNGTTTDGFMVVRGVKLPDTDNTTVDMSSTLEECRARCLANCSCVAYAAADIRGNNGGSGCVMWKNYVVDVRYVDKGQDLYVRLARSEFANEKRLDVARIVLPVLASVLALTAAGLYLVWICRLRGQRQNNNIQKKAILGYLGASNELGDENLELPFVSFGDIVTSTNDFSEDNMLGQGGFGKVYKMNGEGIMAMICLTIFILLLLICFCKSEDQLTSTRPLSPGDLLISKNGVFALGFFSSAGSNGSLYVGIWFYGIPERNRTVVWVANRDNPATTASSPTLAISNSSDLVLSDSEGQILWTTQNNSSAHDSGAFLVLLDTGNLKLQLPNDMVIWQSFDHPTDTILPGMEFLLIHRSHEASRLISWRGPDDPSSGDFSFGLDPVSNLQLVIWHGAKIYCRISVWNGELGGMYPSSPSSMVYQTIVNKGDEFYLEIVVSGGSPYSRIMLDHTGTMKLLTWDSNSSSWTVISERPEGSYGLYDSCGPNGYCDFTGAAPACQCLEGFEAVGLKSSRGCQRTEQLQCGKGSHFVALPGMRVPDKFVFLRNRSFEQCVAECSRNCSCTAYAYANLSSMADQSRCLLWTGELIDTWKSSNYGETLYLRLADPPGMHHFMYLLVSLMGG